MEYKSGDLLARVIGDVETLENFYVRVISPSLTAVFIGLIVSIFFAAFYPPIALVLIGFFLTLGLILPILAQLFSRVPGQKTHHPARRDPIPTRGWDPRDGRPAGLRTRRKTRSTNCDPQAGNMVQRKNRWHASTESILRLEHCSPIWVLWLVLVLTIPQVTAGNIKGVMLGTFALMTLASFEAVNPLPLAAQMWNSSREAAKRLFEVVDAEPAVKETGDPRDWRFGHRVSNSLIFPSPIPPNATRIARK